MFAVKRLVMIGMIAAVALGSLAAALPAQAATCTQWHTVERGEYLVKIARMYDTTWRELAEINDLDNPSRIYPGQKLCVDVSGTGSITPTPNDPDDDTGYGVRVYAVSVEEDEYVTLRGRSLAANARYSVYMSRDSGYHIVSLFAGYAYTDKNGAFTSTFSLPNELVDVARIRVRLSSGSDTSSNWFINATSEDYTGGENAAGLTASIVSVNEDDWVKIRLNNLPANVTFKVTMGKAGSRGVNGILVGLVRDDEGGSFRETFEIPDDLQGRSRIDLRIENKAIGMYYYLTFENEDS